MRVIILIIGFCLIQVRCLNNNPEKLIQSHLKEKYEFDWDKLKFIEVDKYIIFYERGNSLKLEYVKTDLVEQKTNYRFYKTLLKTGHMEYPELEIMIAIPKSNKKKIKELKSPTFTDISQEFLKIFEGLSFQSEEEKINMIKEISHLFKLITYEGKINNVEMNEEHSKSELWHGGLLWRILNFYFEGDKLINIIVENPRSSFTEIDEK